MNFIKITLASISILLITTILQAEITVLKVEGSASYKEGNKWIPLKENQKLSEGAKVSTGAKSFADIKLNSLNHTVRVKPFTMIQIFSKESKTDTDTHIGLKRGGVIAKVPRDSKVKTIFKVSSPIATSSVRGTEKEVTYGPDNGMTVTMLSGEAVVMNHGGQTVQITGDQIFHQTPDNPNPDNPLQNLMDSTFISVSGNGLTSNETAVNNPDQIGSPDDDSFMVDDQIPQDNKKDTTATVNVDWGSKR